MRKRFSLLRQGLALYLAPFRVGVRTGFIEMRTHLLRSLLSALGILFGVFVMVVMLSLMGGLNRFLDTRVGDWMGSVFLTQADDTPPEARAALSRSPGLRFSDGQFLEDSVASVVRVFKSVQDHVRVGTFAGEVSAHLRGVDSASMANDFTADTELEIKEGRALSADDYRAGTCVCVISQVVADDIARKMRDAGRSFPSAVGSVLHIGGQRFRVVGVFGAKSGDMKRNWMRNNIYAPLLAVRSRVTGMNPNPGMIWVKVADPKRMNTALSDIVDAMTALHRGAPDFEYHKPDNLKEFIAMMTNISSIMAIIAFIALLSGGLGIMNVMLSSISERVREIGVRMALGASRRQIFVQFLAETSTLCFTGGIAGALLGCIPLAFGELIEKATDGVILPVLPFHYAMGVLLILAFLGVIFGLYPALKASRMNPIDALRYE